MSTMSLTSNAVAAIHNEQSAQGVIVQAFEIRKIVGQQPDSSSSPERYKMKISDGTNVMQAMLMSSLNELVFSKQLQENALVRLDEFVLNKVPMGDTDLRKICIVLKLTVVGRPPVSGKIGNPVALDSAAAAAAAAPPTRPTAAAAATPSAAFGGKARGAAVVKASDAKHRVMPVRTLTPYNNSWTVKVRVTRKNDVRTWSNARGEGKLFSVELLDAAGDAIRATFFREGVDKFYDMLEEGKVYYMSRGKLKVADKRYSSLKSEYEMTFDQYAHVEHAEEDTTIKSQSYDFVGIDRLQEITPDSYSDIIGVVKEVGELTNLVSRAGRELTKRDLTLVDDSATAVRLTLWGDRAQAVTADLAGTVLAVKGARVGDFGGRSLSTTFSSSTAENPDIPEAHRLKAWWDGGGATAPVSSVSSERGASVGGKSGVGNVAARTPLAVIKAENLGAMSADGRGQLISSKATVTFVRSDSSKPPMYPACASTNDCNKKAVKSSSGTEWMCESCNQSFAQPRWRFILSATVVDHSGSQWITLFNEAAEKLLDGVTADQLHACLQDDDFKDEVSRAQWESTFATAMFKDAVFRLRCKVEDVSGEARQKVSVVGMTPVSYRKESQVLLNAIEQYEARG